MVCPVPQPRVAELCPSWSLTPKAQVCNTVPHRGRTLSAADAGSGSPAKPLGRRRGGSLASELSLGRLSVLSGLLFLWQT